MAHVLVFDSGVGGLSVVSELRARMHKLHITYAADDAFRPYGNKTAEQLQSRLPELLQVLTLAVKPDALVLACNTASTTALSHIRARLLTPVIGVVPAIKPAARLSAGKTIAVLGTPGTVRRKYVGKLISDFAKDCKVALHGSTVLVDMAERKLAGKNVDAELIKREITPLFNGRTIDTVVLACTHFPLLKDEFNAVAPYQVNWVDSGAAIAQRTQSVLENLPLLPLPTLPQTALLIGGGYNPVRFKMFKKFGFEKTVIL